MKIKRVELPADCTVCTVVQMAKQSPQAAVVAAFVMGVKLGKSENVVLVMCGPCEQHIVQTIEAANKMPGTEGT